MISLSEKTEGKIIELAEENHMHTEEFINKLLEEYNEMKFCQEMDKLAEELEKNPNNPMSAEEFLQEMDKW